MSQDLKRLVHDRLAAAGSIAYTEKLPADLQAELMQELGKCEDLTGAQNWILRLVLYHLKV